MTVTIEKAGRRHYIVGNTYSVKDQLRNAGCKWDPDRKAWWTGKADLAARIAKQLEKAPAPAKRQEQTGRDVEVIGAATYKGKTYRLVWEGRTKYGQACKLAFRDGSKVFWADAAQCQVTKRYESPRSIGSLLRYAEQARQAKSEGYSDVREMRAEQTGRCRGCGGPLVNARHHSAMGGYCGSCAFDEFDC